MTFFSQLFGRCIPLLSSWSHSIHAGSDRAALPGRVKHTKNIRHREFYKIPDIQQAFEGQVISRDTKWPCRSPDLTVPDSFLWGYCKDKIYRHGVRANLDELQKRIVDIIATVMPEMLQNVFDNLEKRLELYVEMDGAHFAHLMWFFSRVRVGRVDAHRFCK